MFARFTTVRGDPAKIDAAVDQVDGQIRAAVEATEGNRGFAVLTDAAEGRIVGASYWDGADSLRASEAALAGSRAAAVAAVAGRSTVESFEVSIGFRRSIPARGAVVRLGRFEIEPGRMDATATAIRGTAPEVKGVNGLCSFQLLLDKETSSGMVVTSWEDKAALDAFWPTAERLRARVREQTGTRFTTLEDYTMIRTTVRLD